MLPHNWYELEKLQQFRSEELKRLERSGAFRKTDPIEPPRLQNASKAAMLLRKLAAFLAFKKSKSHPNR